MSDFENFTSKKAVEAARRENENSRPKFVFKGNRYKKKT